MKKLVILIGTVLFIACSKKPNVVTTTPSPTPTTLPSPPPANGSLVSVTVNQNQQGIKIPDNFQGFSFEVTALTTNTLFLNSNPNHSVLIQLIKNFGNGILRVGGQTSDETFWTGKARNLNTGLDSLTTTDIDNFSTFTKATGWQVIFGLNLSNYNPPMAASEATYIYNSLQNNLYAFQTGNEPNNLGKKNYTDYQSEWNNYFSAVRSSVANAPFAGPDIGSKFGQWISSFAAAEYPNIKLVDGHYYRGGSGTDTSITYKTMLATDTALPSKLLTLNTASGQHGLPYRFSECGAISGGKTGVSDVFSATLWALDFMWTVAENNGQGVNFHGGGGVDYPLLLVINGIPTPSPLYYAMLSFKYGSSGGAIVPTTISSISYNCSAYACTNGGLAYLTLINKDNVDLSFNIQLNNPMSTIKVMRLLAPSITSTTGVTLGGNSVNSDGTFNANFTENYSIPNKTNFIINVPAGSAAILNLQ